MSMLKSHIFISLSHSFTHSSHAEQLLFSCLCSKVTLTLSHSLNHSLSHSHLTLSLTHLLTLHMLHNFCFHVYAQKSLSLTHSHTLLISHSLTLDNLNNFCFHLYAQKSLSHTLSFTSIYSYGPKAAGREKSALRVTKQPSLRETS